MKYQRYLMAEDRKKWLELEVTIGSNDSIISRDMLSVTKFLSQFDPLLKSEFKNISNIEIGEGFSFAITNRNTLQILMLKKFLDSTGLNVIQEARPGIGDSEQQIFIHLLKELIQDSKYPEDIYVYSTYRKRGTPTTWLNISGEYSHEEIATLVKNSILGMIRSCNYKMDTNRKLISKIEINEIHIFLLSKPVTARVQKAEKRNIEISSASYTLIILDVRNTRIGVISGSKQEIQIIQNYMRHKIFKASLAPSRTDQKVNGIEIFQKIIKPENPDLLRLQSIEINNTRLPESPSLKIQTHGNRSLDESLEQLSPYWENSSISDLKQADFAIPTTKENVFKKIGIYTYGDGWKRTYINVSTRSIPTALEEEFLTLIQKRLDGIDIKESRFVLLDLDHEFIVNKLLKEKIISMTPPIPSEVEKVIISLTSAKLIMKQDSSTKRKCWNCFRTSWDSWTCPNCDRQDMRIVSEAIRIAPNEKSIMKGIGELSNFSEQHKLIYFRSKQRDNHKKDLVRVFHQDRNLTTFIVMVENDLDLKYVKNLANESFGIVAILDPKLEARRLELESSGCAAIDLFKVVIHLIDTDTPNPLLPAILEQENRVLERVLSNARKSISSLKAKNNYSEVQFEIDIKNLLQSIVPDVIRLGTELSGKSVPDGYCRYGANGRRSTSQGRRLFGWDAKYSKTAQYSLSARDVIKQKKYIDWMMNPKEDPMLFGKLGTYSIIANFDDPKKMNRAISEVAKYEKLKSGIRIVLIEDMFLVNVCEWLLANWQQVLENNSKIADEVFKWVRRKQSKPYSISRANDWIRLEAKLNSLI